MKLKPVVFPGDLVACGPEKWPDCAHLHSHTHAMLREARIGDTVDIAFYWPDYRCSGYLVRCTVRRALDGSWWLVENRKQPKLRLHAPSM